jgi:hypothetical protein
MRKAKLHDSNSETWNGYGGDMQIVNTLTLKLICDQGGEKVKSDWIVCWRQNLPLYRWRWQL